MTDNDIIKALECCSEKNCKHCPAFDENIECSENTIKVALDLINRQKAENERLQANYLSMQETLSKMSLGVEHAQSEAVKEFAKFLIDKADGGVISITDLPGLVVEWGKGT